MQIPLGGGPVGSARVSDKSADFVWSGRSRSGPCACTGIRHIYSEHDKVLLVYSLSSLDAVAIEICRHTTVLFNLEQFSSELYGTLKRNEKYLHRK